jgi:hypothetical protein
VPAQIQFISPLIPCIFEGNIQKIVEKFYTRCRDILHSAMKILGFWRDFLEVQ